MNDRPSGTERQAPHGANAPRGYALALGTFPPIAGPASAASLAAVGALLAEGYRVETVSLSGHGDAHVTLDFAKSYALRRFRRALAQGPMPDCIVIVPGALRMRRPNTAARLLALCAQVYTLCWLALGCRRFMVLRGKGADRAGGWRPAARFIGPLLRCLGGPAPSPGPSPDPSLTTAPSALAASLAAACWGEEPAGRVAASMAALLGERGFGGTARRFAHAAEVQAPIASNRALDAALAPCPHWSHPEAPVPAWMTQLRAARGALPRLGAVAGSATPLADSAAARLLRGWAVAELDADASLAGMANTLRTAGHHPLSAAETAMLAQHAAPERAWAALASAGHLQAALSPPHAADPALLQQLREALPDLVAEDDARPARQENGPAATQPPSALGRAAWQDGTAAGQPTLLGLAVAFAAGVPGGLPLPAKRLPEPLLELLNGITARVPKSHPPLHLPPTREGASLDGAGTATQPLHLVGHARQDMGLGANLAMTAEAVAAGGIASLPLSADNGLEPMVGTPRPATPLRPLRRAATILHLNADRLPPALLHRRLAEASRNPALNIGFLLWEFDRLPEAHGLAVEMLDEIWAPTPFVAEAYRPAAERAGTALTVVGKAVLDGPVAPLGRAELGLPEGAFLFLTSFDFHSSVERKNPLALVRAFQAAFPKEARGARDIALAIKTTEVLRGHWGDPHGQWPAIEAAAAADPRIVLLRGRTDGATYRAILKAADAYVSTHRAEGFGYGPAEAMLRERPVIATDWSGTTAFCTARTAFPVPFRKVPVRPGETILPVPGASWAEIDHDALVETLRHVIGDTASRRARALAGAALMRGTYGLEAHAARLTARLDALGVLHPATAASERNAENPGGRPRTPNRSAA
ncbi:MAG: hypothetical protein AAF968_08155 [Pseudomonadota bacterium]